jgi:outer membrane protein assembly factor BamB
MRVRFLFFLLCIVSLSSVAQEIAQWRGPFRNGVYPEKNLLKEWPADGPTLLWSFEGLGAGQGSPVIANDKVYVTGIPDTIVGTGKLFVFDLQGKLLWTKEYGSDFTSLFAGARSTPTVAGDRIYIESGNGVLYCLDSGNGNEIWKVDFFKDLQADSVQFGFSESPLVVGDRVYFTPGGKTNNMVCFNRFTGEKIWASKGSEEQATYSSPILFNHNGQKIIVNLTASTIMGINADNGDLLWRFYQFQDNKIHANTPVYTDGTVLIGSTSRKDSSGLVMLQLSPDGKNAKVLWRNREVINFAGGYLFRDSCIYTPAYMQPKWFCIDRYTGKIRYTARDLGGGVLLYADGLLYAYTEKDGEMALMDANPEKYSIISRFKVPVGTMQHWAHPAISHGKLFIRHGDALMVYDISEK